MDIETIIGVYVRINANNEIIEVNSDIFIDDLSGWIKIDEGQGDKYAHAQSQYFSKPIVNQNNRYSYMLINNKPYEV